MVDFEWYRSFIRIYKHSSVSEAAKTRIMTQPAMSQHLASLEAEVGEPLFIRASRKMFPTERGKELYSQLAPLIEALEETTHRFKNPLCPTFPVIKLGAAYEWFQEIVAPRLADYDMRVIAYYGLASDMLSWLQEDKLDLIVTSEKTTAPGVEYIPYLQEEFVVVAPTGYDEPEFDGPQQLESWLCSQRWLSYGLELPIIRRFWRERFQKRPQLQPVHILPDLHIILTAIRHGAGVSILPTYMLDEALAAGQVKIVGKPYSVTNQLYFAYLIKNRNIPPIKKMMDLLRQHAQA